MKLFAMLLHVLCGAALLVAPGAAAAQPPEVQRRVEHQSAEVRLWSTRVSDAVERASALAVAEHERRLYLLTVAHALAPRGEEGDHRVEVKMLGGSAWIAAETVHRDDELDIAVIAIPMADSKRETGSIRDQLAVSPGAATRPGERVWVHGLDVDEGAFRWIECRLQSVSEGVILFEGRGLKEGFSGGVLVGPLGPVGLVQQMGNRNQGHRAAALGDVVESLTQAGVPVQLRTSPVLDAMAFMADTGMVGSLYIWTTDRTRVRGTWCAVRLTSRENLRFHGDYLAFDRGRACVLAWDGAGLAAEFGDLGHPYRDLATPLRRFEPTSEVTLDGFVVLRGEAEGKTAFLALPSRHNEHVVSRILANAADREWRNCSFRTPDLHLNHLPQNVQVGGRLPAFPMPLCGNHPFHGLRLEVWRPDIFNLLRVELSGTLSVPDNVRSLSPRERSAYADHQLSIGSVEDAGATYIRVRSADSPGVRTPLRSAITPEDRGILIQYEGRCNGNIPPMLEQFVLRYSLHP